MRWTACLQGLCLLNEGSLSSRFSEQQEKSFTLEEALSPCVRKERAETVYKEDVKHLDFKGHPFIFKGLSFPHIGMPNSARKNSPNRPVLLVRVG